ncbi:hypothetical protein C475_12065 [Halosimplex carlsbadense 2-9-1]|uniref:DUF8152 domain-containing protein n=1 Tax=Halosimplex carlsbadense 2-9-1 TaxID=797114 RepID=M0CRG0_9EURY|nr:hypothetical protein [Halosimplex carlsbadense]ELZ24972.1 hypothetical protein C475_12065 [Halosimplex carlsbadense 2-9-1]
MGDDADVSGGGDSLAERVERLHAELEATEERPVDRTASRWIGEAQAVAGDAAKLASGGGGDEETVRERVGHVTELLGNVDGTGDDAADERVATARSLAEAIAGGD